MEDQDLTGILQNLATVAEFFMINPQYQEAIDQLKKDVAAMDEKCGIYQTKSQVEKALTDAQKAKQQAENLKSRAKADADLVDDERNAIRAEIKNRVTAEVSGLSEKLQSQTDRLNEELEAIKADREEVNLLLTTAKASHDKREEELRGKAQSLDADRRNLALDQQRLGEDRRQLDEKQAKIAALV